MNLHQVAGPIVAAINPQLQIQVRTSTGSTTKADGSRTPSYAAPVTMLAQVQPLTFKDLQQLEGLNIQGVRQAIYVTGGIDAVVRPLLKGGDLVTMPDGTVWLVAQVLEGWSATAGWTKAAITLQSAPT